MGLLPNHLPTRSLSHAKHLTTLSLAITIGFSAVVGTVLWESRGRDREQAKQAASNVIALLSSEIDRNLELYDLSLQAVVDGMKLPALTELSPEMRQLVLFDRAATAKDMGSIFVLGTDGTVVYDFRNAQANPGKSRAARLLQGSGGQPVGRRIRKPAVAHRRRRRFYRHQPEAIER